jgi:hypothetical protein
MNDGAIIMFIVIAPIAGLIIIYRIFNHGRMPCINSANIDNLNKVVVDNV